MAIIKQGKNMTLINQTVLMSDANNFSTEQQINPYYNESPVDLDKAINEHATIQTMLENAGVKVIKVPSPIDSQDGVYTANWALVRGDKAVLASLPNARKAEEDYAEKILIGLGKKVFRIPDGLRFSGQGDSLPCGNLLFCGSGYRSDTWAQKFAAEALGYERIQLQTIPQLDSNGQPVINNASGWADSFFYDLDLSLAILKAPLGEERGLIAYCPDAFMPESQELLKNLDKVDKIIVSIDEAKNAFATNLVSTGKTVIMSANAPKLSTEIRNHGLEVVSPIITELLKGGGYIRCITLTMN